MCKPVTLVPIAMPADYVIDVIPLKRTAQRLMADGLAGFGGAPAPRRVPRSRENDVLLVGVALQFRRDQTPAEGGARLFDLVAQTFYSTAGPVTTAARAAIQAANEQIMKLNRAAPPAQMVQGGVLCAVVRGAHLYVVQAGLGEMLVLQAEGATRLPATPVTRPLGFSQSFDVQYHHCEVAPDDLLLLGRNLPDNWQAETTGRLSPRDARDTLNTLLHLAGDEDLHVLVAQVLPAGATSVLGELLPTLTPQGIARPGLTPAAVKSVAPPSSTNIPPVLSEPAPADLTRNSSLAAILARVRAASPTAVGDPDGEAERALAAIEAAIEAEKRLPTVPDAPAEVPDDPDALTTADAPAETDTESDSAATTAVSAVPDAAGLPGAVPEPLPELPSGWLLPGQGEVEEALLPVETTPSANDADAPLPSADVSARFAAALAELELPPTQPVEHAPADAADEDDEATEAADEIAEPPLTFGERLRRLFNPLRIWFLRLPFKRLADTAARREQLAAAEQRATDLPADLPPDLADIPYGDGGDQPRDDDDDYPPDDDDDLPPKDSDEHAPDGGLPDDAPLPAPRPRRDLPGQFYMAAAIIIPLIIVAIGFFLWDTRVRQAQLEATVAAARDAAVNARLQSDLFTARPYWEQVMQIADTSALTNAELENLRAEAEGNIDTLEGVRRVPMTPVISGGFRDAQITALVAQGTELYALDATSQRVLRLTRNAQGMYDLSAGFQCRAGTYGNNLAVSQVIDIAWMAEQNITGSPALIVLDISGTLLYCRPSGTPPLATRVNQPIAGWKTPVAIEIFGDSLYVLDPGANQIYIYRGTGESFSESAELYFTEAPPDITTAVDFVIAQGEIFILHRDGRMTSCTRSFIGAPPTCIETVAYLDNRPGKPTDPTATLSDITAPVALAFTPPPEPSVYVLDSANQGAYQLSLKLVLQQQYRPAISPRLETPITTLAFGSDRLLYYAAGDNIYVGTRP